MGAYLSQPITDKESTDGEDAKFKYGTTAMQGWRTNMEDAHSTVLGLDEDTAFFGVYDGHGGKEVRANPAPVAPKAESNLTTFRGTFLAHQPTSFACSTTDW